MLFIISIIFCLILFTFLFNIFDPFWQLTGDIVFTSMFGSEFYLPLITGILAGICLGMVLFVFKELE